MRKCLYLAVSTPALAAAAPAFAQGNASIIDQSGTNQTIAFQDGMFPSATLNQSNDSNESEIDRGFAGGTNKFATVDQTGSGNLNIGLITQAGNLHGARVTPGSDGNFPQIDQSASGGSVIVSRN